MVENNCSIFEDIMPLYKEHEVKAETAQLVKEHLKQCRSCRELYNSSNENIFNNLSLVIPEPQKENKFMSKFKKTVISIAAILLAIFLATNLLSYASGRTLGVYGERFKIAEEKDLFVYLNQKTNFGQDEIVLEKVLFDSTVTSLIFKTSVNMDKIDSIVLKDDNDVYYTKRYLIDNTLPHKYHKINGYTVINFTSVSKDAKKLSVELVNWKKENQSNQISEINQSKQDNEVDKKAIFVIDYQLEAQQKNISKQDNLLDVKISDTKFSIDRLIKGVSQTEISYTISNEESAYDGMELWWYKKDQGSMKDVILITDNRTGYTIPVLSVEDITSEKLLMQPSLKKTISHKLLMNPLSSETNEISLEFKDIYGYYNIGNKEITVNVSGNSKIDINQTFECGAYTLKVLSAKISENKLVLSYSVTDNTNKAVNNVMLDARIREAEDIYAVPEEGVVSVGNDINIVEFDNFEGEKLILSLARLGEKLDFGQYTFKVK